jgi:hypothetical protein
MAAPVCCVARASAGHERIASPKHQNTHAHRAHGVGQELHAQQKLQAINQELTAKYLATRIENEELTRKLEAMVRRATRALPRPERVARRRSAGRVSIASRGGANNTEHACLMSVHRCFASSLLCAQRCLSLTARRAPGIL